jgi:hypothetical protein
MTQFSENRLFPWHLLGCLKAHLFLFLGISVDFANHTLIFKLGYIYIYIYGFGFPAFWCQFGSDIYKTMEDAESDNYNVTFASLHLGRK